MRKHGKITVNQRKMWRMEMWPIICFAIVFGLAWSLVAIHLAQPRVFYSPDGTKQARLLLEPNGQAYVEVCSTGQPDTCRHALSEHRMLNIYQVVGWDENGIVIEATYFGKHGVFRTTLQGFILANWPSEE